MERRQTTTLGIATAALAAALAWAFWPRSAPEGLDDPCPRATEGAEPCPAPAPLLRGSAPPPAPPGRWKGAGLETAEVSGRVVDGEDRPVAEARVRLFAPFHITFPATEIAAVSTDAEGAFVVSGLGAEVDAVRVLAEHEGSVPSDAARVQVPTRGLLLRLLPGFALEVVVRRPGGAAPAADALVAVQVPVRGVMREVVARTDAAGQVSLRGLAYSGVLTVNAHHPEHGRARLVDEPWHLDRPLELTLDDGEPTATVRVRVLEQLEDGTSVPRAQVRVKWSEAGQGSLGASGEVGTDAKGTATFRTVAGSGVALSLPGLPDDVKPSAFLPFLASLSSETHVEVLLVRATAAPPVRVSGRVVDEGGSPVPGAEVGVANSTAEHPKNPWASPVVPQPPGVGPADREGRFAFEVPSVPGSFRIVYARARGYLSAASALLPDAGARTDLRLVLTPSSVVEGRVVDEHGRPVEGARVVLNPRSSVEVLSGRTLDQPASSVTGPDGRFRVDGMRPRKYWLILRPPWEGNVPSKEVEVGSGSTSWPDLVLLRGETLEGEVVTEEGVPVGTALVGAHSEGGPSGQAWTDARGRFAIPGLARGANVVTSGGPGFAAWKRREVSLPHTGPYRVVLQRGREIAGLVQDAEGRPILGAAVLLNPQGDDREGRSSGRAVTDRRGRFRLVGAPMADVRLLASAPDHVFVEEPLGASTSDPVLRALKPTAMGGRVLDERGEPVAGATVRVSSHAREVRSTRRAKEPGTATTDAQGRFRVEGLFLPPFAVQVSVEGVHRGHVVDVAAERTDVEVRLSPVR